MNDEADPVPPPESGGDPLPRLGRIMGIDWGEKRIGLALSDPGQTIGHPLDTLVRRSGRRFPMKRLRPLLDENEVAGVVVGLPLTPEGDESDASRAARDTAALIKAKSQLPVAFQDERFSTSRALAAIQEMGGSTRNRKADVDKLSAAVMLQTFLDGRRP